MAPKCPSEINWPLVESVEYLFNYLQNFMILPMRTDLRMIFIDDAVKNLINIFPQ